MEEIMLSIDEHKLLRKFQTQLEAYFDVRILVSDVQYNSPNDIILATVCGEFKNRNYVKKFLQRKMIKLQHDRKKSCFPETDIPVVVLSESDSDNSVLAETENQTRRKKRKLKPEENLTEYPQSVNLNSMNSVNDNSFQAYRNLFKPECTAGSSSSSAQFQYAIDIPNQTIAEEIDDSIIILSDDESDEEVESMPLMGVVNHFPNETNTQVADDSVIILSDDNMLFTEPSTSFQSTSQTADNIALPDVLPAEEVFIPYPIARMNNFNYYPNDTFPQVADDNVIILSEGNESFNEPFNEPSTSIQKTEAQKKTTSQTANSIALSDVWPAESDFILLKTHPVTRKNLDKNDDFIVLSDKVHRPLPETRILRPIVIDGSNVAREHGKIQNVFSCKGIKLSIEYFLKHGHTQVTAFVPNFRRHCRFGRIPTTDQNLLEELARTQNVVFTPSRRINGKLITCYDDRFIVDLATRNRGVILSNDNYRDIAEDSPEFKKTIEERLLMYCFVGDILMIPDDPLGRHGPKLNIFLSMEESTNVESQANSLQFNNQMLITTQME